MDGPQNAGRPPRERRRQEPALSLFSAAPFAGRCRWCAAPSPQRQVRPMNFAVQMTNLHRLAPGNRSVRLRGSGHVRGSLPEALEQKKSLGWLSFFGRADCTRQSVRSCRERSRRRLQRPDQRGRGFSIFVHVVVIVRDRPRHPRLSRTTSTRKTSSAASITRWFCSPPREWGFSPAPTSWSPRSSVWK